MRPSDEDARPFIVFISGTPGSGKTTLGWVLSRRLHVPFISRDDIKTGLHVTHRSSDPTETWRFASRAFDTFYESIDQLVGAGVSLVAEAAFHAGRSDDSILERSAAATLVHVALTTPDRVALDRYAERALSGRRHPAHNDVRFAAEMASGAKDVGVYRLTLPCPTLEVDSTDGWRPGLEAIASFVDRHR